MYKIVIIGAGQLGSRHLQGLLNSNLPASIEVIDPNIFSLENAQKRASEVNFKKSTKSISFLINLTDVSPKIDLCIIACTANVRYSVIQKLLSVSTIRYLILEKILFQELDHYDLAAELFSKYGIQTWVNCPRRMVPEYKQLQSRINTSDPISFFLLGSNWGLACNAIHFIDLFAFFTGDNDFLFNSEGINKVIPSKRDGFYELSGTLTAFQRNSSEIILHSREYPMTYFEMGIMTKDFYCTINEIKRKVIITEISSQRSEEIEFSIPFQSQLTNELVEKLFHTGNCDLTTYSISSHLHTQLLSSFIGVFKKNNFEMNNSCPIT